MHRLVLSILALLVTVSCSAQEAPESARMDMLEQIRQSGPPVVGDTVLSAMARVPRDEFVPPHLRSAAYDNRPLPIGQGQTISQPYIVALMTDLAEIKQNSVVFEVGTGSGYQAAVLAELAAKVYTIEIIDSLAQRAAETLARLGYDNVKVKAGDGYAGWPEYAPFDAILVTAAPDMVPQPLLEQLKPGGRLVIPVGPQRKTQMLKVLTKQQDGSIESRDIVPVVFVPFTRDP